MPAKKPEGEKFVAVSLRLPPQLAADLDRLVAKGERSRFVQDAIEERLAPLRVEERLARLEGKGEAE